MNVIQLSEILYINKTEDGVEIYLIILGDHSVLLKKLMLICTLIKLVKY